MIKPEDLQDEDTALATSMEGQKGDGPRCLYHMLDGSADTMEYVNDYK